MPSSVLLTGDPLPLELTEGSTKKVEKIKLWRKLLNIFEIFYIYNLEIGLSDPKNDELKVLVSFITGACTIKLFMAVIY